MYLLFIASTVLELCIFAPFIWRLRDVLAPVVMIISAFSLGWLLAWQCNPFSVLVAILGLYRIVNLLRLPEKRLHTSVLKRETLRSSVLLISGQLVLGGLWYLTVHYEVIHSWWLGLGAAQVLVAALICAFTLKNVIKLRFAWPAVHYSDHELPTVTVAVPARNETSDLAACLDAIVGSDYPKLEILVLDDCSQDKTSDVIRGYAQSGVRFLHGSEPKTDWLAKNQAYDQLANEANGDFILFLGVDTTIGRHTIRSLVTLALARHKKMISVLPERGSTPFGRSFIQPMRYWWELALPRKLFNRPPVLSTCWLIERAAVKRAGGFAAVSQSVLPEAYFAKQLIKDNAYSFIRSSGDLAVASHKNFRDQLDRAIRLHYPQLHRRLELVAFLSLFELLLLLGPFVLLPAAITSGSPALIWTSAVAIGLLIGAHLVILASIGQPLTLAGLVNFPLVVMTEVILGNVSLWKYEFSTVDWKGRNICLPVMRLSRTPAVRKTAADSV